MMPPIVRIYLGVRTFLFLKITLINVFIIKHFYLSRVIFIKYFRNSCRDFATGSDGYLACLLYIFNNRIMVGNKWKNRSNRSIGRVSVPFLSMINFSSTCGMGLNGARSIRTATKISAEKGILSRKARIVFLRNNKIKRLFIFTS
jgi:hypothetical protein